MLRRAFAFTLAMLLCLCGSATSEELGISNGGGVNLTSSPNEIIVSGGSFVGALDDIQPGWYSIAPADEVYTKTSVFDCYSFDEPVLLASYAWWEDGTSLLTTEAYPEEYVVPLREGCLVLAGYCGGLEYNASTGEAEWEQYDDALGRIRLEYVAPLSSSETAVQAVQMPEGEFEVPPGTYVVGEDFPAGVYTVKHAEGESLFNIFVDDADGRSVFNDGFWASKDEYLGKIELLDGFSVKIDQGVALFVPYKGLFADTSEEPAPAPPTAESEIVFHSIPWLTPINKAVELLGLDGKLREGETLYSWGPEYTRTSVENAGFEYAVTGIGNSFFVAGHSVNEVYLWALYGSGSGSVEREKELSKLYKAAYYFDDADKDAAYNDLLEKLSDLYGSPAVRQEETDDRYAMWYGANNTGVILRKQKLFSTVYLSLCYGRSDADSLIAELKTSFAEENQSVAGNEYDGL